MNPSGHLGTIFISFFQEYSFCHTDRRDELDKNSHFIIN